MHIVICLSVSCHTDWSLSYLYPVDVIRHVNPEDNGPDNETDQYVSLSGSVLNQLVMYFCNINQ